MNEAQAHRVAQILYTAARYRVPIQIYVGRVLQSKYTVHCTLPGRQFIMSHTTFYDVRLAIRTIRRQGA